MICVNTDGSGGCLTSIADAIDIALPQDEIQVAAGTYTEGLISVVRKLRAISGAGGLALSVGEGDVADPDERIEWSPA